MCCAQYVYLLLLLCELVRLQGLLLLQELLLVELLLARGGRGLGGQVHRAVVVVRVRRVRSIGVRGVGAVCGVCGAGVCGGGVRGSARVSVCVDSIGSVRGISCLHSVLHRRWMPRADILSTTITTATNPTTTTTSSTTTTTTSAAAVDELQRLHGQRVKAHASAGETVGQSVLLGLHVRLLRVLCDSVCVYVWEEMHVCG